MSEPFPSGVASGDPTTRSVRLWTRVPSGAQRVRWWLTGDAGAGRSGDASAGEDGIVVVDVDGLAPGTLYRYGFEHGGHSIDGVTRTLPERADGFRLAICCCSRWASGGFELYGRLADAKPDLVLHLGDYIYEDGGAGVRAHDPPHECTTLADYHRRYCQHRTDPDLRRLHASAPWVSLWDDHEIDGDAWRRGSADHDSAGDPDWERRRAHATEAFARWMPQRTPGNGPTAVDRHVAIGDLADLVLVDTRLAGRQRQAGGGGGPSVVRDAGRRLLTDDQWCWLERVLGEARGRWLLIASSVQFAPLRLAPVPTLRGRRTVPRPALGWLVNPDQWDGYPDERRRLLDLLSAAGRAQTVVLSGDLHARFATTWRHDGGTIHEVTTPSITAPTFAALVRRRVPAPAPLVERWLRVLNPHLDSIDLRRHGATVLDIAPERVDVRAVRVWGDDGRGTSPPVIATIRPAATGAAP